MGGGTRPTRTRRLWRGRSTSPPPCTHTGRSRMRSFTRAALATAALLLVPVGVALAAPQKIDVPMDGVPVLNVCSTLPDVLTLNGYATLTADARVGNGGVVQGKV